MLKLQDISQYIQAALTSYPPSEQKAIARLVVETVLGASHTDLLLDRAIALPPDIIARLNEIIQRLATNEPVQYVLGQAQFAGLTLSVNSAVLIPRPETEGLVDWAVETMGNASGRLLDIGTGSGCIALALDQQLPHATIEAWDVSQAALAVAQRNIEAHGSRVRLFHRDLFLQAQMPSDPPASVALIASNPPYIPEREQVEIEPHVLQYEPHQALFVPDYDPLLFYRHLAKLALSLLQPEGALIVETHRDYLQPTADLFELMGLRHVETRLDCFGLPRFVKGIR